MRGYIASGGWVRFLLQPDQRHDSRQRHQHRRLCVRFLLQPDQRHDCQRRHQHRDECVLTASGLTSVTIPASVTNIGELRSLVATSLTAITVDTNNSFYSSVDGVLFDKSQTTLIEYPGGLSGSYTIPGSVTSIGDDAFYGCTGLTSVTIPGSVTSIGNDAFY